jgi:hypothetical protein
LPFQPAPLGAGAQQHQPRSRRWFAGHERLQQRAHVFLGVDAAHVNEEPVGAEAFPPVGGPGRELVHIDAVGDDADDRLGDAEPDEDVALGGSEDDHPVALGESRGVKAVGAGHDPAPERESLVEGDVEGHHERDPQLFDQLGEVEVDRGEPE